MDLDNYTEKMQDYMDSLQKEKTKILVFQSELPLCLDIVSQAIESCKQQLSGRSTTEYNVNGQSSECSEQTTSTEGTPVLEEFIPMKRDEDDHEERSYLQQINDTKKKSDWLTSAQLWNQTPDPLPNQDVQPPRKVVEVKRNYGAFQPFHSVPKTNQSSEKLNLPTPVAATSSTAEPATGSGSKREKNGQNLRKQRRCWSPELHRRFLQALQQLGGSHAATPKQIRELMKVDSLTNDEVKSHLQCDYFREVNSDETVCQIRALIHTPFSSFSRDRRLKSWSHPEIPTTHKETEPVIQNNSSQPPQIVVVGGIWVPPQEYAAMTKTDATKTNSASGIYAPIATTPGQPQISVPGSAPLKASQNRQPISVSEERSSHGTGGESPSTSSSSHTTTASPMYLV